MDREYIPNWYRRQQWRRRKHFYRRASRAARWVRRASYYIPKQPYVNPYKLQSPSSILRSTYFGVPGQYEKPNYRKGSFTRKTMYRVNTNAWRKLRGLKSQQTINYKLAAELANHRNAALNEQAKEAKSLATANKDWSTWFGEKMQGLAGAAELAADAAQIAGAFIHAPA